MRVSELSALEPAAEMRGEAEGGEGGRRAARDPQPHTRGCFSHSEVRFADEFVSQVDFREYNYTWK